MSRYLLSAVIILCICNSLLVYGQSPLHFKRILKDQGLASNKVNCISQDKTGFIWFGTEDGLTRYDGTQYVVFRHDPEDQYSLVDNNIISIYVDPHNGNLWVATNMGLCYLDIKTYKFHPFVLSRTPEIASLNVISILIDEHQNKWIGTVNGLYCLPKGAAAPVLCLKHPSIKVRSNINCLFRDSKKALWVGTNFGLYTIGPDLKPKKVIDKIKVLALNEDRQHNVWVSTFSNGVLKIAPNRELTLFNVQNGLLKSDKVQGVAQDDLGNIFMAVRDGGGLHYFDQAKGRVTVFGTDIYNPNSISSVGITCIYKDKFSNIWIGTASKGVNFIDRNRKSFSHYTVNFKPNGLRSSNIRFAFQDSDGDIWIGTKEDGSLSKFNPAQGSFVHHLNPIKKPGGSEHYSVLSITEGKPGYLVIGTYGDGLRVYNKYTGSYKTYRHNSADKKSLAENRAMYVFKDRYDGVWVATARALQLFDQQKGTFTTVDDSSYVKAINDFSPTEIYWGGNRGLYVYNRTSKKLTAFHDKRSKACPVITGLANDGKGNLWITTVGQGLIKLATKTKKFTHYTTINGLPSNVACGIENDRKGNLWISTTNGLSRFNLASQRFKNYYLPEGLQGNEFEKYVSLRTKDGHLLFGGGNGFNYFYPDSIKDNVTRPNVVLTDLRIFNKPVKIGDKTSPLSQVIGSTKELTLNYTQSVFSIEFAAINFSAATDNQYAYKLEPLEKEWNYSARNLATYTSLPAGTYTFKVKAANNDGVWSDVPAVLSIKILPAPWKSFWAYLIYISIVVGLIYLWLRYKSFETRLHISQVEQEKLKELNRVKSHFFTNISHEFKTPLTMILGPLDKLMKTLAQDDAKKQVGYIHRNAIRLQNLINQLMEFRSIENNSVSLNYTKGDIVSYVTDLAGVFQPLIDEHQIKLDIRGATSVVAYFDTDKTEKIFYNIISNAVKFTPDGGTISISINLVENTQIDKSTFDGSFIEIRVSNTGSKIEPEHLPHLFENYYHIDRKNSLDQPGTGIGLAFAKELVDLLGGTIDVESTDECTAFTVRIPEIKLSNADLDMQLATNRNDFVYAQQLIEVLKFEKMTLDSKSSNSKAPAILIVEDNKELQGLLFTALGKDYKITIASNGLEGLEIARKTYPALILSDIVMPKLSGIELCKEIKSHIDYSHIPVVLLTASSSDARKMQGMQNGADVYIEKPFNLDFLKLQIKNILQTRKAQREAFAKKISAEPEKMVASSPDEHWMSNAVSIVEKHLDNPAFDVDLFVREIGMGRTALYQKIKALTDLSIHEFIINIRLKRGVDLLLNTDLTVAEIAYKTGFSTPQNFGRCFKKSFNMSPTSFVEKHKRV